MTTLVHTALALRKTARAGVGYACALALAVLDLLGVFLVSPEELGPGHVIVGLVWTTVFFSRAGARVSGDQARNKDWFNVELGLLLLGAFHAVLQVAGGLTSRAHPAGYILIALLTSLSSPRSGRLLVLSALLFEAGLYFFAEQRQDLHGFALHAVFLVVFGSLNLLVLRAELGRMRLRYRNNQIQHKRKLEADARLFRLVGASSQSARDDERLFRSSVDQVHQFLHYTLAMLKQTLDLHTCVLLLKDDSGARLRIAEAASDSDDLAEGPFPCGEGAVGAAASRGQLTNLEHLRPGYEGVCYYRGPAPVRAFVAVPVRESSEVCGALCADRLADRPFEAHEEQVLAQAAGHALRALENERVFVQLLRSKHEQTVLHKASRALGAALNADDVWSAALEAATDVVAFDFAAITHYDPKARRHTVRRAVGEGARALEHLSFRDNASLTAMAVKNRHYLPYRGEYDHQQQTVYTRKANLKHMRSVLILPLIVREQANGTLALAARRKDAFSDGTRFTLQALANQLAVALANAASVRRLEELATTDGLTGCYNKRAFLEEFDKKLKSAQRFGRRLSLVITDIDHFKSVNDTYGHAAGDHVIRQLAVVLKDLKRETDVVARFGGEEFCLLCEETDTEGALQLAERVRETLEATVIQTELGKVRVTCSLGVATYPEDASDQTSLFEQADRALYSAKNGGRNQVRAARAS
ncbi:MAG: sensor domain-containing diguanylate cyclase [Proteobacteria bacterium]|nr:sensor domain-containing diguanylate cyclase [Pseudomonadota bacterium]